MVQVIALVYIILRQYPKKINCLGTDITINKFERNDKGLNIEIEVNDSNFSYFGDVNLDGSYCAEEGYSENNTHEFVFNIKEKDNYKLIVEPIIKYKIPIDIDFTKEQLNLIAIIRKDTNKRQKQ